MTSKWERAFSSTNAFRAEIVKSVLECNNIPAIILNRQDSSYHCWGNFEVHVSASNTILAAIIIEHELEFE